VYESFRATASAVFVSFVVLLASQLFCDVYCFMLYLFEQINQHREHNSQRMNDMQHNHSEKLSQQASRRQSCRSGRGGKC